MEKEKPEIKELKKKLEEYLNGWKKERASFLNYKKEEMERIGELIKYANEELILKILPVLDNFDIAERNLTEGLKNDEHIKGILQIKIQILEFLKTQGVEKINCLGKKFNPNLQEAVGEVERSDSDSGIVVEEIKKGYLLHGKIIRPVKVKISK